MTSQIERDGDRLLATIDGDSVVGRVIDLSGRLGVETARAELSDPWTVTRDPPPLADSLARAARSQGLSAPQADRIAALEARLASGEAPESPDLTAARRRVAETEREIDRLRERVATLRGRLTARREAGLDTAEVEETLQEMTRELTEAETDHHAAREMLDRTRREARRARDDRERRLRLRDELRNRRQDARAWLAARVAPSFVAALDQLGGLTADETTADPLSTGGDEHEQPPAGRDAGADERVAFDGAGEPRDVLARLRSLVAEPVAGRLAAITIAADDAPVVLTVDRDPERVADQLDRPVLKV